MSTDFSAPLKTIRHSLRDLEDFLQLQMELLAAEPDSLAYQLSVRSLELRREDMLRQRTKWLKERGTERVELRFKGPSLQQHVSLRLIGGALAEFQSMLDSLGRALHYGSVFAGFIPRAITERTAVGLTAVGSGSVVLSVEGPTQPTLYGESLLVSSIENLFDLLDAGADSTKLLDMVGEVGLRSLLHYAEWAKMIIDEKTQIAVSWNYLEGTYREWEASSDQLAQVHTVIDAIKEVDKREEVVVGLLQGASHSTSRFFLVTEPGHETISGNVPIELQPVIKEFFGKRCTARIIAQVVRHEPTGATRTSRTLISLGAPP
jgi:hypothetical protein